jgi:primosomal protein N' (replication factor Y) (superfamily II helicase)
VARVIVDVPLPHLDRVFDYSIPAEMAPQVTVGSRVRVRFSGRLVDAFVVDLTETSEHRLQPVQRVITGYPVLTPEIRELARAVADRYAGSMPDVLRAALPPRHARAETSVLASDAAGTEPERVEPLAAWSAYSDGPALMSHVADGDEHSGPQEALRAVMTIAPGGTVESTGDWPTLLANLAAVGSTRGGVVLVVPDARDLARVQTALTAVLGRGSFAVLSADLGPQRRYAEFLRVLTGRVRVVLGTRAAAFAPVVHPRLFILWDDGDESLSEPHAPGWHAREVLALRSHQNNTHLVVAGFTRTVETQAWIASGWARAVAPERAVVRRTAPRVIAESPGDTGGRIPRRAFEAARDALREGPVLVQVARRGYVPTLACQRCRTLAACPTCGGPLALSSGSGAPACRWCSTRVAPWQCRECGGDRLRALAVGSGRTAEELGRAFPGVPVLTSTGDKAVVSVGAQSALVIATPGTEPYATDGYAAVLLLDASAQLSRVALRAGEETARRWFTAAALARPEAPVVVTSDAAHSIVQALIRWDAAWLASRELEERRTLALPPIVRAVTITGEPQDVDAVTELLPPQARAIGPLPTSDGERSRLLVTIDRRHGSDLTAVLQSISAERSARKEPGRLHIAVDPPDWGGD